MHTLVLPIWRVLLPLAILFLYAVVAARWIALTLTIHPQTHPPGLVVLHWLVWQGFASVPDLANSLTMPLRALQCYNAALMTLDNAQLASSVVGMLILLAGAFTVWPLYALGRRLVGARQAALAAAIFPVLPMFVMWPAQWDQVYPLFLLTSLYFVHTGLEARLTWRFTLAGVVLSGATFLSLGSMIMVVIAMLYISVWWLGQTPWRQLFRREIVPRWLGQILAFDCTTARLTQEIISCGKMGAGGGLGAVGCGGLSCFCCVGFGRDFSRRGLAHLDVFRAAVRLGCIGWIPASF